MPANMSAKNGMTWPQPFSASGIWTCLVYRRLHPQSGLSTTGMKSNHGESPSKKVLKVHGNAMEKRQKPW